MAVMFEFTMRVPLASRAQVRILAEELVEPAGPCEAPPAELAPRTEFRGEAIRRGLPEPGRFPLADCRWRA